MCICWVIMCFNDQLCYTERLYEFAACKRGALSCHRRLILLFQLRHQENKRVQLIRNYTVMSQQLVVFFIKFCFNFTLEASPPPTSIKTCTLSVLWARPSQWFENLISDDFAWFLVSCLRNIRVVLLTKEILKFTCRSLFRFCLWKLPVPHRATFCRYRNFTMQTCAESSQADQPRVITDLWLLYGAEVYTYSLTHSTMQSPSWAANWFAASQEIPRISRNPNVHYRTNKRPPPVPILSQPNPVNIPTSHLLEIHPNIIHLSTPGSPQWSLSLRFPHQDPIHPLSSPIRATCPAHLILLDFITRTILDEEYKTFMLRYTHFWDITQRKLVVSYRRFVATYRFHLQRPKRHKKSRYHLHSGVSI